MSISQRIRVYHDDVAADEHHRYRSWEHCFQFFRGAVSSESPDTRDTAALQLGFYLASWGMYRGSSFLLQRTYTAHLQVIDCLVSPGLAPLWRVDFGSSEEDAALIPAVISAAAAVKGAYLPFGQATETLVTKVLLGTLGCVPACDRYFRAGFKSHGHDYSRLNSAFIERLLQFCNANMGELKTEQERIKNCSGFSYPLMKLVDMYFWQLGFESAAAKATNDSPQARPQTT